MFKRIAITLMAVITFIFAGADIVASFNSSEAQSWSAFHTDAVEEYEDLFTSLFNSYETKWSKNGRLMIRTGDSGSFKFVKKGFQL